MELEIYYRQDRMISAMRIEVFSQNSVAVDLVKKLITDGLRPHLRTTVNRDNLVQLFFFTKDALQRGRDILCQALTQIDHQAVVTVYNCPPK